MADIEDFLADSETQPKPILTSDDPDVQKAIERVQSRIQRSVIPRFQSHRQRIVDDDGNVREVYFDYENGRIVECGLPGHD